MTIGALIPALIYQGYAANGTLNSFGTFATYAAGSTTPIVTFSDPELTQPNPNPVKLNAIGQANVWLTPGLGYKFIEFDQFGNQCGFQDQVNASGVGITSNVVPALNNTFNIGSPSFTWANGYFGTAVYIGGVSVPTVNQIGGIVFPLTQAETQASVTPTNFIYQTQPYDIRRYGAKIDGATDDTAAWNAALLVASQNVNGAPGSSVSMPAGVSMVSSMLFLPNRVRVLGSGGMSSWVRATPGWTVGNGVTPWSGATNYTTGNLVTSGGNLYIATQANVNQSPPNATFWTPISNAMFYAQNGYVSGIGVSMFYSTLENLTVDANLVTGLGCVLSSSWQEGSGLRNCLLYQFATYGVRFQDGFGGAALSKISDCNIFPGSASAIGIDLSSPIGAAAAFMLDVSNTSIAGPPTLTAGISVKGNSLCARNVHFENCTSAVLADGLGYISIDDMSGASSNTSLVQLASTFNGDLILKNARRNGVSNFLNDLRPGGYGAIVSDHPLLIINANDPTSVAKGGAFASAWCVFNGFTAGTNAPLAGYNVTSVTRNSTGNYTVSMLRPMLSANGAAFAMSNLATGQHSTVLSSATTFTVVIEVGGVATDSAEVKALVFGA